VNNAEIPRTYRVGGFRNLPAKPKRRSFTEFVAIGDLEPARQSRKDVRSPNSWPLGIWNLPAKAEKTFVRRIWLLWVGWFTFVREFAGSNFCRLVGVVLYEVRDFEILRDLRFYAI
jgi:hypothetical protein